ncbi:type II toxin-antitoxin system VapC family toxin [Deinococcus frigens]|uniref:type II toxin-antitoxin system VapC family toxin n=1 Tax=Deinococcus frigens TaxID=249403 RepID=UPI00138E4125|nr:type II toxin-antitoxin system VapC family toxin [Deinococcus frigens]
MIDTNIALRLVDISSPQHLMVKSALSRLVLQGDQIILVPHIFYELWAVMTRPTDVNGLGWPPELAHSVINGLNSQFLFLADTPAVFDHWLNLVSLHRVSGKKAHDARLAAVMQAHGLDSLLTFNETDFKRFGISVITPTDLSSGGPTL